MADVQHAAAAPKWALAALLVLLPLAGPAQNATTYSNDSTWPRGGTQAPGYGRTQVSAVATDARGRVFAFQRGAQPVLVFDREGNFLYSWGAGMFGTPHGCRVDPQGNLWLTDIDLHQVFKFNPDGQLLLALGERGRKGNDASHFNGPADVAFGPSGDVFVADGYGNGRIVRFSLDGAFLGAWGGRGKKLGQMRVPHSVAVAPDGRVFVADRGNKRIQVFSSNGTYLAQWRKLPAHSLAITADGRLFVGRTLVYVYDLNGRLIQRIDAGAKEAHMLCVDENRTVYVADVSGRSIRVVRLQ